MWKIKGWKIQTHWWTLKCFFTKRWAILSPFISLWIELFVVVCSEKIKVSWVCPSDPFWNDLICRLMLWLGELDSILRRRYSRSNIWGASGAIQQFFQDHEWCNTNSPQWKDQFRNKTPMTNLWIGVQILFAVLLPLILFKKKKVYFGVLN